MAEKQSSMGMRCSLKLLSNHTRKTQNTKYSFKNFQEKALVLQWDSKIYALGQYLITTDYEESKVNENSISVKSMLNLHKNAVTKIFGFLKVLNLFYKTLHL